MITITDGIASVQIPVLDWIDEFGWQPVAQAAEYSLTGALVVETATRQTGRPITLATGDDRDLVTRSTVAALAAWAAVPGQVLSLTLRGVPRDVLFRHQDGAMEAQPVLGWSLGGAGERYRLTLRFLEIE